MRTSSAGVLLQRPGARVTAAVSRHKQAYQHDRRSLCFTHEFRRDERSSGNTRRLQQTAAGPRATAREDGAARRPIQSAKGREGSCRGRGGGQERRRRREDAGIGRALQGLAGRGRGPAVEGGCAGPSISGAEPRPRGALQAAPGREGGGGRRDREPPQLDERGRGLVLRARDRQGGARRRPPRARRGAQDDAGVARGRGIGEEGGGGGQRRGRRPQAAARRRG